MTPANVVVVGRPEFADMLAKCGAYWVVHPAAPDTNMMWDAFESGALPLDKTDVLIIADGTGGPGDIEGTIAAFIPFYPQTIIFLFAEAQRGASLVNAARQLPAALEGGNPNTPVYVVPPDMGQALPMIQQALSGRVAWTTAQPVVVAPTPQPVAPVQYQQPIAPVQPQPVAPVQYQQPVAPVQYPDPTQVAPVQYPDPTQVAPVQYQQPAPPPPSTPIADTSVAYQIPGTGNRKEMDPLYSADVLEQATQNINKLPNARPGQMTIACMSSKGGSGKCGVYTSRILDPKTGLIHQLGDIVTKGIDTQVASLDGRFIVERDISNRFSNGVKPTFKVRLRSGREFTGTDNHPLLTTDGWTELGSIQPGETVATPSRLPFPLEPVEMDAGELDLLALIMAEGGTSQPTTYFTNFDPSLVETAKIAAESMGIEFKGTQEDNPRGRYHLQGIGLAEDLPPGLCGCGCGEKTDNAVAGPYARRVGTALRSLPKHPLTETTLKRFRRTHGLDFVLAKNKTMPEAVFRLSEPQLARFIALFWMCDGYAVTKGGGDLGVTLASRDVIEALQHLLLRFGILSKIRERITKANGKEFPAYRLTVYSQSYATFAAKIPMWGPKAEGVRVLAERSVAGANPNVGMPTFSEKLRAELTGVNKPGATRAAGDALGWNIATHLSPSMVLFHKPTKRTGRQHLSLQGLRAYTEATGTEDKFGWIYDSEIFWDEVESITPAGDVEVFDIEVPGPHNFVADDIIVHNSTSAILLAGTIARCSAAAGQPKRVVVVDLDTRDGQVGSLLGQYMPTAVSIRVMPVWDAATITSNLVHDKRLGIDALLAPVRPRNADDVGPDFYRQIIQVLQTTHDVVILDCSVNYLDPLLGAGFALADEILFVTTLAGTSVQGMARAMVELFTDPAEGGLGIPREKVGIVANQVINNVGMGKDRLLKAALGAPLVGQIPADHDMVLVATNSNRMSDLLKHPTIGPAFFKLASRCLPGWALAPLTAQAAQVNVSVPTPPQTVLGPNGVPLAQPVERKKGIFGGR